MSDITVKLVKRTTLGKGLNSLRKEGKLPVVIHNQGKESVPAVGDYREIQQAFNQAGTSQTVKVDVDSESFLTLIRDVDLDPTKHTIRHVVFQSISQNKEVEAEVPIVFADTEIPAEKKSLMVLKELENITVKALPKDLPEKIEVDLSSLSDAGDVLRVGSINIPKGVTLITSIDTPIAIVEVPRDQLAEANAAAEALAEGADKPPVVDEGQPEEAQQQTDS